MVLLLFFVFVCLIVCLFFIILLNNNIIGLKSCTCTMYLRKPVGLCWQSRDFETHAHYGRQDACIMFNDRNLFSYSWFWNVTVPNVTVGVCDYRPIGPRQCYTIACSLSNRWFLKFLDFCIRPLGPIGLNMLQTVTSHQWKEALTLRRMYSLVHALEC